MTWDPRVDSGGRTATDPRFGTERRPLALIAFGCFWAVYLLAALGNVR